MGKCVSVAVLIHDSGRSFRILAAYEMQMTIISVIAVYDHLADVVVLYTINSVKDDCDISFLLSRLQGMNALVRL